MKCLGEGDAERLPEGGAGATAGAGAAAPAGAGADTACQRSRGGETESKPPLRMWAWACGPRRPCAQAEASSPDQRGEAVGEGEAASNSLSSLRPADWGMGSGGTGPAPAGRAAAGPPRAAKGGAVPQALRSSCGEWMSAVAETWRLRWAGRMGDTPGVLRPGDAGGRCGVRGEPGFAAAGPSPGWWGWRIGEAAAAAAAVEWWWWDGWGGRPEGGRARDAGGDARGEERPRYGSASSL